MNFFINNIVPIIGLFLSFIAICISFYIYKKQHTQKGLVYKITTQSPLFNNQKLVNNRLKIIFDGKSFDNIHLIELCFINSGNTPIEICDFYKPLTIIFNEEAQIITADIKNIIPDTLDINVVIKDESRNYLEISPTLLNPKDSFTLQMLVHKFDSFHTHERISGIKSVEEVKDISSYLPLIIYSLLLGMIGIISGLLSQIKTLPIDSFNIIFKIFGISIIIIISDKILTASNKKEYSIILNLIGIIVIILMVIQLLQPLVTLF